MERERERGTETPHLTHYGCAKNIVRASVLLAFTQKLLIFFSQYVFNLVDRGDSCMPSPKHWSTSDYIIHRIKKLIKLLSENTPCMLVNKNCAHICKGAITERSMKCVYFCGGDSMCELHLQLFCVCERVFACLHSMTWSVWRRRASCRCRPVCPWPP